MKLLDRALNKIERNPRILESRHYDIKPGFRYFLQNHFTGKIWGAYCTYYRWDWDINGLHKQNELVFIISGHRDRPRVILTNTPVRELYNYSRRRTREGFVKHSGNVREDFPEICDRIDKVLMWVELKR